MKNHRTARGRPRAARLLRVYNEGETAFLSGVAESECPYADRQRHAAWRIGWSDEEIRSRISSPVIVGHDGSYIHPITELRQCVERYWSLISYADQDQVLRWLAKRRAQLRQPDFPFVDP